jgi:hypothetical protein
MKNHVVILIALVLVGVGVAVALALNPVSGKNSRFTGPPEGTKYALQFGSSQLYLQVTPPAAGSLTIPNTLSVTTTTTLKDASLFTWTSGDPVAFDLPEGPPGDDYAVHVGTWTMNVGDGPPMFLVMGTSEAQVSLSPSSSVVMQGGAMDEDEFWLGFPTQPSGTSVAQKTMAVVSKAAVVPISSGFPSSSFRFVPPSSA